MPLTLTFRSAGKLTVDLIVEARDALPAADNEMTQTPGTVTVVARRPQTQAARRNHNAEIAASL